MSFTGTAPKTYRTMKGVVVDMDKLERRNELTPAVGNARVNARGDQLGPGGKIIRSKEQVINDHYRHENTVSGPSSSAAPDLIPRKVPKVDQPRPSKHTASSKQESSSVTDSKNAE